MRIWQKLGRPQISKTLIVIRTTIKTLLIIGFLILGTTSSLGCNCNEPSSVEEAFNYSDAVFHGKVIHKSFVTFAESMRAEAVDSIRQTLDENQLSLFDSEFIIKVEFEIIKCYKGNLFADTIVIYTTRTSASCGYSGFEIGKDYIVYGEARSYAFWTMIKNAHDFEYEKQNTFWTNHCTRTYEYNYLEATELEKLRE